LGLSDNILYALKKKGFEEPTLIQKKIIPLLLQRNGDLVGQAQTGTGKTAAFGIPIIEKIVEKSKRIQALILVPTRELAIQVSEEINSLKGRKKIQVIPVYGGQAIELQLKRLKKGVDVVVGTPGRILDHIKRGTLKLLQVSYVVLDEADEMLNMGFIEDVEMILSKTNLERTTLLFSATMPSEIVSIAKKYMKGYEVISIENKQVTVEQTDQIYFEVSASDKFEAVCRIIDVEENFYGLIFCRTKVNVDEISNHMADRGYDVEALHGDLSQTQREKILQKFKKKRINILVATDVAARGIDINDLTHVINFAIPQDADAYVHRIGRTGRAGKEGTAITFITPEEYRKLMYIQRATKTDIRKEKLPKIHEVLDFKKLKIQTEISKLAQSDLSSEYVNLAQQLLTQNSSEKILDAL
jgi:ATP-dependent RNA helicase DeaD